MRFKLKSDYLSFAREQIRGGLWYKPPWWDAVSRVPPAYFQPRIAKKDVPRIKFMEDKLLRKFQLRNPSLAVFDNRGTSSSSSSSSSNASSSSSSTLSPLNSKTLSAAFVEKQLSLMRTQNMNEEQAYKLTQVWLLENGKNLCQTKLHIPYDIQTILNLSPSTLLEARKLIEQELQQQVDDVRTALRTGNRSSASTAAAATIASSSSAASKTAMEYRFFPSSSSSVTDLERVSSRGNSKEYVLPRGPGYESDEELKLSSPSSTSSGTSSSSSLKTSPSTPSSSSGKKTSTEEKGSSGSKTGTGKGAPKGKE